MNLAALILCKVIQFEIGGLGLVSYNMRIGDESWRWTSVLPGVWREESDIRNLCWGSGLLQLLQVTRNISLDILTQFF